MPSAPLCRSYKSFTAAMYLFKYSVTSASSGTAPMIAGRGTTIAGPDTTCTRAQSYTITAKKPKHGKGSYKSILQARRLHHCKTYQTGTRLKSLTDVTQVTQRNTRPLSQQQRAGEHAQTQKQVSSSTKLPFHVTSHRETMRQDAYCEGALKRRHREVLAPVIASAGSQTGSCTSARIVHGRG